MVSRASAEAARSAIPTTLSEALIAYEKAYMTRREPSEASRRQSVHYARKAVRLMKAETLALSRLNASVIRLMIETAKGSAGERHHVFGGLSRFLSWCRKQQLIEHNPCDSFDRNERPKPGKAEVTSRHSKSYTPFGPPPRTSRCAISSGSFCSRPCDAVKRRAFSGAKSISTEAAF